jgi:hypothetical protein
MRIFGPRPAATLAGGGGCVRPSRAANGVRLEGVVGKRAEVVTATSFVDNQPHLGLGPRNSTIGFGCGSGRCPGCIPTVLGEVRNPQGECS